MSREDHSVAPFSRRAPGTANLSFVASTQPSNGLMRLEELKLTASPPRGHKRKTPEREVTPDSSSVCLPPEAPEDLPPHAPQPLAPYMSLVTRKTIKDHKGDMAKVLREEEQVGRAAECLSAHKITEKLRGQMVNWMVEVLRKLGCPIKALFKAVELMDLYYFKNRT